MNDDYDVEQVGATVRFGIPITEALTASVAYNYAEEKYDLDKSRYPGNCAELLKVDKNAKCDSSNSAYISPDEHLRQVYSGAVIEASENSPWRRSSISYGFTYNTIGKTRMMAGLSVSPRNMPALVVMRII